MRTSPRVLCGRIHSGVRVGFTAVGGLAKILRSDIILPLLPLIIVSGILVETAEILCICR